MTTNAASTYLAYANVQMAAEALLDKFPYTTVSGLIDALKFGNNRSSRFTEVQAKQFASEWEVIAHQPDTATGFSGTVFKYIGEDDPSRGLVKNQLVMSFRSTEFADDAARDNEATNVLEVKEFGWGFGQIDDMKKWVDGLYASGKIAPTSPLNVTGYSLGGHLATAFNLLYPGATQGTYTFNSAGVGTVTSGSLTQVIAQFDRQRMNVSGNEITFTDPRATTLMSKLDTHFANDAVGLSKILRGAANVPSKTYENTLDALRHLLLGSSVTDTDVSSGASDPKRASLYDNMDALAKSSAFRSLAGKVSIASSSVGLASTARNDFASLLSLITLSPVALKATAGNEASVEAALATAWGTTYTAWQADKAMTQADRDAGKETYTQSYLDDRASMLSWIVYRNTKDNTDVSISDANAPDQVFRDFGPTSTTEVRTGSLLTSDSGRRHFLFGGDSADVLNGGDVSDHLYGGAGADTLKGLGGADYLEGNTGDDSLNGGEGSDVLLGGTGSDTYQFDADWGKDIIKDSDGKGAIQLTGTALGSAKGAGKANQWAIDRGGGVYAGLALYDDSSSSTGKRLVIVKGTDTANTITIDNFDLDKAQGDDGYLGIKLDKLTSPALVEDSGTNVWTDPHFELTSLTGCNTDITEGTGKTFTIYLNQAAKDGDTLTLALSELGDKFKALIDGSLIDANGAVIELDEGQTQVSFALVQSGDLTEDGSTALSVTYAGAASTVSNSWDITLHDTGEAIRTYNGDQHGALVGSPASYDTATIWATDGTLIGGVVEHDFADVIYGSYGKDKISGLGGNDALNGGDGADTLDGGAGDDLIGGGLGSDHITGGEGNDVWGGDYLDRQSRVLSFAQNAANDCNTRAAA